MTNSPEASALCLLPLLTWAPVLGSLDGRRLYVTNSPEAYALCLLPLLTWAPVLGSPDGRRL